MKGGNTDEIYKGGTYAKSKMIADLHPDVASIVKKYGRWHHHVDYSPFRANKFIRDKNIIVDDGINNYGMNVYKIGGKNA